MTAEELFAKASELEGTGQEREAEELYKQLVSQYPESPLSSLAKKKIHVDSGQVDSKHQSEESIDVDALKPSKMPLVVLLASVVVVSAVGFGLWYSKTSRIAAQKEFTRKMSRVDLSSAVSAIQTYINGARIGKVSQMYKVFDASYWEWWEKCDPSVANSLIKGYCGNKEMRKAQEKMFLFLGKQFKKIGPCRAQVGGERCISRKEPGTKWASVHLECKESMGFVCLRNQSGAWKIAMDDEAYSLFLFRTLWKKHAHHDLAKALAKPR